MVGKEVWKVNEFRDLCLLRVLNLTVMKKITKIGILIGGRGIRRNMWLHQRLSLRKNEEEERGGWEEK